MPPIAVAVVGPGAIGAPVAAALHAIGRTPTLCGRTPLERLTVVSEDGTIVVPGPVLTDPDEIPSPARLVFLAVKTFQIEAAAGWLSRLCDAGTVVCVLQNGVEQAELVGPHAGPAAVVPGIVWFPAEATGPGEIRLRGALRLTVPDDPSGRAVAEALAGTVCAVEFAADFTTLLWRKLVLVALAGLMVLGRGRAGIFRRDDVAALAHAYALEFLAVARAEGADLPDSVADELVDRYRTMPADLGTSMLFDADAGRALEWDARNGVIVRRARVHGLATPIGDVIVPLLAAAGDRGG